MIVPAKIENGDKKADLSEIPDQHRDKVSTKYLSDQDAYEVTLPPEVEIENLKQKQKEVENRLNEVKMPQGGPMKKLEEAIDDLGARLQRLEDEVL